MAHEIMELDKGVVQGNTWHRMPQYVTQETPPTKEQAAEVLDFPMDKLPVFRQKANGEYEEITGQFYIVRTDHDKILVPSVGCDFTLEKNLDILEMVDKGLREEFPDLKYESIGTMNNGRTAFINLKVDEFQITGDKSPTITRIAVVHDLGWTAYVVGGHSVRIVCMNTCRMAMGEMKDNKTRAKIKHTPNALERMEEVLKAIASEKMGLKTLKEHLEFLAAHPVDMEYMNKFVDGFFPMPDPDKGGETAKTRVENTRNKFYQTLLTDDGMDSKGITRYGILQAVTRMLDWREPGKLQSVEGIVWDGMFGASANRKDEAMRLLMVN